MAEIRLRHRARMREKDVKRMNETLMADFGFDKAPFPAEAERAEATDHHDVILHGGRILGLIVKEGDRAIPAVRALLANKPPKRYVTVDMGAIKFVTNGADVMAPGIVEADPAIQPGDLVWIRDERNKQPLAVGEALVPGTAMPRGPKGKAVKSLHFVGDLFWGFEA
ncbi:MAG TPA: PUA domain-containing protein [Candidatus Thermoplasmatota archaeon]|nr:PUA domain-containing protein [Candidatus Thermoplasmatota archaeon]